MRKVTEQTCKAFLAGKPTRCGNTATVIKEGQMRLVLYGKTIARRAIGDDSLSGIQLSLAGWPTVTTRDRLNGICRMVGTGRFYQKNNEQYFVTPQGDTPIDCHDWIRLF